MKVLNNQNTKDALLKTILLIKKTLSDIIDIYVHEWTNKSKMKNSLC